VSIHALGSENFFFVIPVSKPSDKDKIPDTWDVRANLRTILRANFPNCATLADIARV